MVEVFTKIKKIFVGDAISLEIETCFPHIQSVTASCSDAGHQDHQHGAPLPEGAIRAGSGSPTLRNTGVTQTLDPFSPIDFSGAEGRDGHVTIDLPNLPLHGGSNHGQASDTKTDWFTPYVPLHLAALKGNWDVAEEFLFLKPEAVRASITHNSETALHIAAGAGQTKFVQQLVTWMTLDDLALQNKVGNTALCFAAASGIVKIAKVMINRNTKLPSIRGSNGAMPLCMAALLGHKEMVVYLLSVTKGVDLTDKDRTELLVASIKTGLYDVALDLIKLYPQLALERDGNGETALHVLAKKLTAFPSGTELALCQQSIYSWTPFPEALQRVPTYLVPASIRRIFDTKLMHRQAHELVKRVWEQFLLLDDSKIGDLLRTPARLLFTAAELGNFDFIIILIRMYPSLIWKVNENRQSIFHVAVVHRQEKIFNLMHEIGAHKDLIAAYRDESKNNMLHLAARLAPPKRLKRDSGAALQLRRELHWFKEVEKIVQPSYREMTNSEGMTPQILFSEEHKGLVQEGEKWMKDTASSCMVVATLIATVVFAAAFTVPGGNNNDTGKPIFLKLKPFMVFAIFDALALFSAATSILMFLSILTSRYAEEDFLHSLPNMLIMGLATLFVSIATMMIAFAATLFIVLGSDGTFAWIAIPIFTAACVPFVVFVLLQFPLLADMVAHIYNPLFHKSNHLY